MLFGKPEVDIISWNSVLIQKLIMDTSMHILRTMSSLGLLNYSL